MENLDLDQKVACLILWPRGQVWVSAPKVPYQFLTVLCLGINGWLPLDEREQSTSCSSSLGEVWRIRSCASNMHSTEYNCTKHSTTVKEVGCFIATIKYFYADFLHLTWTWYNMQWYIIVQFCWFLIHVLVKKKYKY